jgi:hypothetical protein
VMVFQRFDIGKCFQNWDDKESWSVVRLIEKQRIGLALTSSYLPISHSYTMQKLSQGCTSQLAHSSIITDVMTWLARCPSLQSPSL